MPIYGIDISSNNPGYKQIPTAGLSFAVVKLTQGAGYVNPLANEQLAWARSHQLTVGVYHWVEPWVSAHDQAQHFIDTARADGPFSFWALDCEDASRPASDTQWGQCVGAMLAQIKAALPQAGSVYVGQYFHPAALLPLAQANFWWLPNYGPNDGTQHVLDARVRPVIHQYTSAGGLDHNVVLDEVAFQILCGAPAPQHAPAPTPTASEADVFLCQAKGSPAVYTSSGVHVANETDLNAWKAILVGISGRPEAGRVWPVEQSFIDSLLAKH